MKTGIIYRAISPSGKSYIGQTTYSLYKRQYNHLIKAIRMDYQSHFSHAIRKYGFDSFIWEIIEKDIPVANLNDREIAFIRQFDSYYNGYNSTIGGSGNHGFQHSEVTKLKMSIAAKKRQLSPKFLAPISKQARQKISTQLSGRPKSAVHKAKISNSLCKYIWKLTDPQGVDIYCRNLSQFCRQHGLNSGHLSQVALGKKASYHGWTASKQRIDLFDSCDKLNDWKLTCAEDKRKFLNGIE